MSDESYHFDNLVKEMVVSQLKGDLHAHARAAEIARQTIVAGIKGMKAAGASKDSQESVRQICHGTMAGLFLIEKDLADGAVALLQNLAEAAQELGLDPAAMMTWTMEGIARITLTVPATTVHQIQEAIESKFMGAGEVFSELCKKAKA